ncbi:hypothetical protein Cgig2_024388 [Carnegiea gigantea]|uniref:Uncharacterized protein n=1 Tax=Carnegiea gigantea TaxID=171969 RepID=A0A9Q1JW97_9CARY|nr:hypothetical protein Cgig2_024388 [Carnegiea gigantea]
MEGGGVIDNEVVVNVRFGGSIQEVLNGGVSYVGGRTECVWMWENMGAAIKLVELLRESFGECKLWFSMKFDKRIIVSFGRDSDLLKLVKGNDEFVFMYVDRKDGLMGQVVECWKYTVRVSPYVLQLRDVKVLDVRIAILQMQLGAVMDMVKEAEVVEGWKKKALEKKKKCKNDIGERIEEKLKLLRRRTCRYMTMSVHIPRVPTQRTIYMNNIHPTETHDLANVDNRTGGVIGGHKLDEDYNRRIIPPQKPRPPGRPEK